MEHIIILSVVFFIISAFFSMLGMGGGMLYVPILLFAGFSLKTAPSISLILILATSIGALFHFSKNKMVDWKLALVMDPPTDIMAFVGGYYSSYLPESYMKILLIIILIISGTLMIRRKKGNSRVKIKEKKWYYWHRHFNGNDYTVNLPLVILATSLIGIISGMLGITGGVIKLPIMVLLCGVPMGIAVATSTVMVALTALFGLFGHAIQGNIDYRIGLILGVSTIIGGLIGGKISLNLDKEKLKKGFGVVLIFIAVKFTLSLLN